MQNRDIFLNAGGEGYHYIPALNDRPDHIDALVHLIEMHAQGWSELDATTHQQTHDAEASKRRALDLGAKQ